MCWIVLVTIGWTVAAGAQKAVSFAARDGWIIHADQYGAGDHAVVLIHGGRFTKESWRPQAENLVKAGLRVLAIDMRGFGMSKEGPPAKKTGFGSPLDALAAVRYLRSAGAARVSIVGASMGADAAAGAAIEAGAGEIDRLVLLAGSAEEPPEKLNGRKLFVVTRQDANAAGLRLPRIQAQYDKAPQPKRLLILEGDAHAQAIFQTDQAARLMDEVRRFLLEK
jgi:pimeloyl-ACP methyl ester carboxylesterase